MFQRLRGELKGAFDTIADEQNRLRAQQASPTPARRSIDQSRPQPSRPARPRLPPSELSGPDADPSQFVIGDEASALGTPEPSKVNGPILEASTHNGSTSEATPEATPSSTQIQTNGENEVVTGDVQSKLRKLTKLETKYSELLKAYRRAHARNSLIEPFEARLRETTPLTSIGDPEAFVEYISQLSAKGDMVMAEFKKVSGEKDTLKLRLDEAEEKTKAAYQEMTQLREQRKVVDPIEAPLSATDNAATASTIASPVASSPKILSLGKNLFSPRQRATHLPEEADADMFSVEDEVPKLQAELQERNVEVEQLHSQSQLLKGELASARESAEHMMTDLEKAQKELETAQAVHSEFDESKEQQITQLRDAITVLESNLKVAKENLDSARTQIGTHEREMVGLQEVRQGLEKELEDLRAIKTHDVELPANATRSSEPAVEPNETAHLDAAAKKKKNNKKKKKKGPATGTEPEAAGTTDDATTINFVESPASISTPVVSINAAAQLKEKDEAIDRLHAKLKSQDDMLEEIEGLKDDLLNVGQEHVDAKEKIKEIEAEKGRLQKRCEELETQLTSVSLDRTRIETLQSEARRAAERANALEEEERRLQSRVRALETEIASLATQAETSSASSQAREELSKSFEDLRVRSKTLESDLTAAQQLATTRYKEMASLRDLLSKAQPELTTLRTEVLELKSSRDELTLRNKDLRKLELREESLRNEIENLKKETATKDSDVTSLRQKVTLETNSRIAAEETNRRAQRDLQRAQAEASNASTDRDAVSSQLTGTNQQLEESRTRLKQLERQVEQLKSQSDSLRDEISLKTAQHASAESLMRSVRDQASEMATQMKEAQGRCESLEEELNDAHRLMSERGREGETMRRLLSEVEQRAESRVKEMRERMEMAVQERDRAEDEANSVGRRRTREVEEVKGKLRDAEREARRVKDDKEDLERIERDLRRQKDDDLKRIEGTTRELEDVRRAMAELRDALDDGEKQTRDFEVERNELKRSMHEAQQRVEKLQKSNKTLTDDLRSLRSTRMRPTDSPVQSSRSSLESARRVASPAGNANNGQMPISPSNTSLRGSVSSQSTNSIDFVYLKNVLLQFLEQKDKQHQMQLVPVLSMLLKFDKRDEQKWTAAIAAK